MFDEGLISALDLGNVEANSLYFEYLDLERNKEDPDHRSRLKEELRSRYSKNQIDLILTIQQPALNFLLNEGKDLAPAAPAVSVQAPLPGAEAVGSRRLTSLVTSFDIKGTLELALEIFPETRRVVFVSGASEADKKMAETAARVSTTWVGKLEFEHTSSMSLDAMLQYVAKLPPQTIIIFTQYNRDTAGKVTVAYEVEGMLVKAANAPVFGLYDFNLRNGGIGGSVVGVRDLGERTGKLALELLSGKVQLTQPVTSSEVKVFPMFDWGQIKRWGGDPRRLPANTVFVNRAPTFWEQYGIYAVGVLLCSYRLNSSQFEGVVPV